MFCKLSLQSCYFRDMVLYIYLYQIVQCPVICLCSDVILEILYYIYNTVYIYTVLVNAMPCDLSLQMYRLVKWTASCTTLRSHPRRYQNKSSAITERIGSRSSPTPVLSTVAREIPTTNLPLCALKKQLYIPHTPCQVLNSFILKMTGFLVYIYIYIYIYFFFFSICF